MAHLPLFLAAFQGLTPAGRLAGRPARKAGAAVRPSACRRRLGRRGASRADGAVFHRLARQPHADERPVVVRLRRAKAVLRFSRGSRSLPEGGRTGRGRTGRWCARLIPDPHGRYSLPAIRSSSGLPAATVATELWKLAWKGELSNDSFVAVRKAILNRFVLA